MCIADLLVNIANKLSSKLKAINASLANKGQTEAESFDDVPAKIDAISMSNSKDAVIEPLQVTQNGTYTAPDGVDGYSPVTVTISAEPVYPELQNKTITPTKSEQAVSADNGYDGLGTVTVNAIPDAYIIPSGTGNLMSNGTFDITKYAFVTVSVDSSCEYVEEGVVCGIVTDDALDAHFGLSVSNLLIDGRTPSDILILYNDSPLPSEGMLSYSTASNFGYHYSSSGTKLYPAGVSYRVDGNDISIWGDDTYTFAYGKKYKVVITF